MHGAERKKEFLDMECIMMVGVQVEVRAEGTDAFQVLMDITCISFNMKR